MAEYKFLNETVEAEADPVGTADKIISRQPVVTPTTPAPATPPPVVSTSGPFRQQLYSLDGEITNGINTSVLDRLLNPQPVTTSESQKLLDDRRTSLSQRRDSEIASINSAFDQQAQQTKQRQVNETGTTSMGLARIGGYLGSSGSEMGVLQNLSSNHQRELSLLEQQRQATLQQARTAYEDKDFELARSMVDEAKQSEQMIFERQKAFIDYSLRLEQESRTRQEFQKKQLDELTKSSREGAILGLIQQGITDPMQILNYANYDEAGNQIGDLTLSEVAGVVEALKKAQVNPKQYEIAGGPKEGLYQLIKDENGQVIGIETLIEPQIDPLEQAYKKAQIEKIYSEIASGQGDEPLSPTDAKTLGVPYGTTKSEAAKLGIIPTGMPSAEAQKLKANVTSGLNALKIVKRELYSDENKDLSQPGDIRSNIIFRSGAGMAREYTSAISEMKDVLVRLRTGAAISEAEEKYYQKQLPMLTDNEATVRSKLKRFEDLFSNLGAQSDSSSSPDDLFNEFEGGSEGTNPKAPSNLSLNRSLSTKTLASAVLPKFPSGSTGGQCVTFLHKLADFPSIGDGKKEKFASVDKFGIPKAQVPSQARVGMILITDENKTYGHGAMINSISADGKYARLTESNFKSSNKVSHDRVIALNDPKIYGAILPKSIKTNLA